MRKTHTRGDTKKQMGLTSHAAAMDLMIQFPGNGVVPRQCLGPIPQFFMGTSPEQGVQTFLAHRQAVQHLQHLKQNSNRYRLQHNRLERTHHLDQRD